MKQLRWLIPLVVLGVVAGIIGVDLVTKYASPKPPVDTASTSRSSEVINAIKRIEEVALLGLGIQGIVEKSQTTTVLGMEVPGSARALYLQYAFTAKLGIDGADVDIEQGDHAGEFVISIPEFVFIGHDDVEFKLAVEDNGVLSFMTPEIDEFELVNEILNDSSKQEYVNLNDTTLRAQAKSFYTAIAMGIDPEIDLDFDFGEASGTQG